MSDLLNIRCSSLPRILSCPASATKGEIEIDQPCEMAALGSAGHEVFDLMLSGDESNEPPDNIHEIAAKHGVEIDDLLRIAWGGLKLWRQVRDRLTVLDTEVELSADFKTFHLTGHADAICQVSDGGFPVIIDWKTGPRETNYLPQIMGYAALLRMSGLLPAEHKCSPIFVILAWTRLGVFDTYKFSPEQLNQFVDEIDENITSKSQRYAPGDDNCGHCPHSVDCQARRALLESAGNDLMAITGKQSSEITPERLVSLYPQSRMLKKALEQYESQARQAVISAGGKIAAPGGMELAITESNRTKIFYRPELLTEFVSNPIESLSPTITKNDLAEAISEITPRGQKGKRIKACMEMLQSAGAVEVTTVKSLEWRKAI